MHVRTQGGTYVPLTPTTEVVFYGVQEKGQINWVVALKSGDTTHPLSGTATCYEDAVFVIDAIMQDFEQNKSVSRPPYIGFSLPDPV
jgi:hypothetical protein